MYKLLIVDDESEIRNGLSQYFPWNEVGFEVAAVAEDAQHALLALRNSKFDAMLCDIRMPGMLGIDLAHIVHTQYPHVQIILLSGYKEFEYAQRAIAYGVRRYLIKPTNYSDLLETFQALQVELDNLKQQSAKKEQTKPINDHYIVRSIKQFVFKHYANITLDNVAKHVHMNPHYVSKLFKQKTGINFSDFVIEVKMRKAIELLQMPEYKTYEISEKVGYSNPRNFTRAFKSFYGHGPKSYRDNQHLLTSQLAENGNFFRDG